MDGVAECDGNDHQGTQREARENANARWHNAVRHTNAARFDPRQPKGNTGRQRVQVHNFVVEDI